jgi:hypothetical protein
MFKNFLIPYFVFICQKQSSRRALCEMMELPNENFDR